MSESKHDATDDTHPVPPQGDGTLGSEVEALAELMRILRSPNGCAWDAEQTHRTLRPYLIEETYEVLEKLDSGDMEGLREELGDLLLQIVYHTALSEEENLFTFTEVAKGIREKMIRRHPHVFGDVEAHDSEAALRSWEKIKLADKEEDGDVRKENGTLSGVPKVLPSLTRAHRVQEKMAGVGFDWPSAEGALDKLDEEVLEAREAILSGDPERAEEEIGDLLFSVVNAARLAGFSAEESLRRSTEKVILRFRELENLVKADGHKLGELSLEVLDDYWEKAKIREKRGAGA
ncbi:MAG: nucleoside triphosphate pyrophosphohydrolase [bacterium]